MVKSAIIAVVAILFFSFVIVGAADRWGYGTYGPVYYYGQPFYQYLPIQYYPGSMYYPNFNYPDYAYPMDNTLSSRNMYRYGAPAVSYPYSVSTEGGRLCGLVDGQQFGCEFGMVCDYTKTNQKGIGVCTRQSTYPYYG